MMKKIPAMACLAGFLCIQPNPGGLLPDLSFSPPAWATITMGQEPIPTGVQNVSCEQARKIIRDHRKDSNFVILDFRTKEMFDEGHIEGAVVHDVRSPDIDAWLATLNKSKVYLIYCTLGQRSGIALGKMKGMSFGNILHMHEGLAKWKNLGYETVRNPGAGAFPPPAENSSTSTAGLAFVTYLQRDDQESTAAMLVNSIRRWGGDYADAPIYVVLADRGRTGSRLEDKKVAFVPLALSDSVQAYPFAAKAFAAAEVEERAAGKVGTLV